MLSEVNQPRILFFASGPSSLVRTAAQLIDGRFAGHRVDLVVSERLFEQLAADERQRVVFVAGRDKARLRFLYTARREPYWLVGVVLAGQPGYFTMKLSGLLLGLGRVTICFNENADAFALDAHHARIIVAHILNRLGKRRTFAFQRLLLRLGYAVIGEPVGLTWIALNIGTGWLQGRVRGRPALTDARQR